MKALKNTATLDEKLHMYSRYLLAPSGVDNLWTLVSILKHGANAKVNS